MSKFAIVSTSNEYPSVFTSNLFTSPVLSESAPNAGVTTKRKRNEINNFDFNLCSLWQSLS